LFGAVVLAGISACAISPTSDSPTAAPGVEKTTKTQALGLGARALQDTAPVELPDDRGIHQCAIYDGQRQGSEADEGRAHRQRPAVPRVGEQHMWHPHDYEMKSGLLIAPGLPQAAEHELMEKLVGTWGQDLACCGTPNKISCR
jgi:Protein of unknown function (DUF1264)